MEDLGNEMEKPGMVVNTCSPNTWEGGPTQKTSLDYMRPCFQKPTNRAGCGDTYQ